MSRPPKKSLFERKPRSKPISKGSSRKAAPSLPRPSFNIFSYYKGYRHDFETWYPTDYRRWLPLIERFGPETPAREFCGTEIFLSYSERDEAKKAYLDALEFWWGSHNRKRIHLLIKYKANVEVYFNEAKVV